MATLYLDHRDIRLVREGQALALYQSGERRGTVPLNMLERVVARSSVQLDTGLLGAMAEHDAGLLVLGGRGGRRVATLVGRPHADVLRRLGQYRRYDDEGWRAEWSRRLVRHKLLRQARLLRRATQVRPDLRRPLLDAVTRLSTLADKINPPLSLSRDSLRGTEGAGAAAYFNAYARLFPPALSFTGRNRRPPRDPVNACLSLAYTLLHFEAVSACHAAGLDPMLGYFHEPTYGRESLAADMIEPLRAHADRWIWDMFRERQLRDTHFQRDADACLLGKAGRQIFYEAFEGFVNPLRRLLRRVAMGLARQLADAGPESAAQRL